MVRVAHQKSKQAAAPSSARGAKIAKQRKNHKVVIESDSQDKEKSRAVLSFRAEPPPGYTFIPAGNPQLTAALKEFAKKGNHQILAVTTTPHATRHELSREVHRIGFHFPTEVVAQVCNHYGIRLTSGGKLVEEKDDDKLFMRLYQKGQLVLDEKVRDQVTINTEAKQIIQDLFPNIPDNDLFQIIKTAFQLGDGKVGTADEIPLVRRAQLSVVAHIRHVYTNYDKLLRSVPYSEARHRVEKITLQKLIDWRGDGQDDKQAMDDTLREVVVISDEEESDEMEEGQLLENEDLRVQPINSTSHQKHVNGDRPRSPIEIHSEDEAPRGYRYLPQVVRRYPVQDPQAVLVAQQQSRYAVWDRVRQEYRSGIVPEAPRVVERILLDEVPIPPSRAPYTAREPLYVPEQPPRRVVEPAVQVIPQPSQPTYIRAADGKLYERITAYPEQISSSVPLRKLNSPAPVDYRPQYITSRPASPRPLPPRLHRRTESYDNNDGTVLQSIEGSNSVYPSPTTRRNPFEESRSIPDQRNFSAHESNHRHPPFVDLTNSAENASKRRRVEGSPPSPYLKRQYDRNQDEYSQAEERREAHRYVENARPSEQHRVIPLENPLTNYNSHSAYDRAESRLQPSVVYRQEIIEQGVPSPRTASGSQLPLQNGSGLRHVQSPRRVEYVRDYDTGSARHIDELNRRYIPSQQANGDNYHSPRVNLDQLSLRSEVHDYQGRGEPWTVQPGDRTDRNPFDAPVHRPQYPQDSYVDRRQREYLPSATLRDPPSSGIPQVQYQLIDGRYQPTRTMPPPTAVYRDGQPVRTTYVQN